MRALTFEASIRKRYKEVHELTKDIITSRFAWETFYLAHRIQLCETNDEQWDWLEMELDLVRNAIVGFKQLCDDHPRAIPQHVSGSRHGISFLDLVNVTMFDDLGTMGHGGSYNQWNNVETANVIQEYVRKDTIIGKKIKAIKRMIVHLRAFMKPRTERSRLEARQELLRNEQSALVEHRDTLKHLTWRSLRLCPSRETDYEKYRAKMMACEITDVTMCTKLREYMTGSCSNKEMHRAVQDHCRLLQFWRDRYLLHEVSGYTSENTKGTYMELLRDMGHDWGCIKDEAQKNHMSRFFPQFSKMIEYALAERRVHDSVREIERLASRISDEHVRIQEAEDELRLVGEWDAASDLF
jgi:hypothetical protein